MKRPDDQTPDPILVPHDPAWARAFAQFRDVYASALNGLILGVEHIGSTAIPDLMAKPILDMDIVLPDDSVFPQVVERLFALGYTHAGDQGIAQRRDALRRFPDRRAEYEGIKREIAQRSHGDRKTYAQLKETTCRDFVERVIAK
jgi:GrpB-like predicted nucleotidyltransferase (UPF0157 family)